MGDRSKILWLVLKGDDLDSRVSGRRFPWPVDPVIAPCSACCTPQSALYRVFPSSPRPLPAFLHLTKFFVAYREYLASTFGRISAKGFSSRYLSASTPGAQRGYLSVVFVELRFRTKEKNRPSLGRIITKYRRWNLIRRNAAGVIFYSVVSRLRDSVILLVSAGRTSSEDPSRI